MAVARLEQGLMQRQIAEKADMSLPTYCSVERGKRPVKNLQARIIAKLLKEDFNKLFKKNENSKWIARMPGEIFESELPSISISEVKGEANVD